MTPYIERTRAVVAGCVYINGFKYLMPEGFYGKYARVLIVKNTMAEIHVSRFVLGHGPAAELISSGPIYVCKRIGKGKPTGSRKKKMGCDPDWLECECTGGRRTFFHSADCTWTKQAEKREDERKETIRRARNAVLSFIASSPCSHKAEDISEFIKEHFPGVFMSDLHLINLLDPHTLTYNRNYIFRDRTGNFNAK